jgi:S1-C subfamily serine protease
MEHPEPDGQAQAPNDGTQVGQNVPITVPMSSQPLQTPSSDPSASATGSASEGAPAMADPYPDLSGAGWGETPALLGAPALMAKSSPKRSSDGWRWMVVCMVAALVGAGVGGSIVAGFNHSSNASTVRLISAGPALLNGTTNIESVIAKVLPAVVSIDAKTPQPATQSLFGQGQAGGVQESQGTGMIITSNGEVVTNNHVISGATTITVTLYGQTKALPATLVDTDPTNDVALLKITNVSNLPTVTYGNSDNVQVGDAVVAIGNALGLSAGTPTVTQGIISAKGRTVSAGASGSASTETLTNMFQTDAAINPGNSGGPLVDSSGKVIGMNTAVAASANGGSQAQNIGFAIPANKIGQLLPGLRSGTINPQSGFLGVSLETLTAQLRNAYNFIPSQGAVVIQVHPGSPADVAGLQQGDVIISFDGKSVSSADQLATAVQNDRPGQSIKIGLYRGQQQVSVTATLSTGGQGQPAGG